MFTSNLFSRFALILLFTASFPFTALANTSNQSSHSIPNQIGVLGHGRISVEPDLFHFNVLLEEKGTLVTKLNQVLSSKSENIVNELVKGGVNIQDIQSMHVQLQPWYEYTNNRREQLGFSLTRVIKVRVKEISKFDQLIDRIIKAGATGIEDFHYSVSQPQMNYLDALDLAIVDARLRAERIANGIKAKVGDVISVTERGVSSVVPLKAQRMELADSSGGYVPGQVDITAEVEVIFELKK
ncbi:SIMPL domain-containing protein [Paraneptunicella aestuarii]|uniref:SIMPL domain-containing protein n=1 Tax=Paraneptunicella aestuarii TaxID=2831148 RepID=UPI001E42292B|nr:SIMPL domain-containing protein [Paraneptunicella aestuarii]UAA37160.1 SIMPL domain-containing protein [Paraneptunicella aestuarii]